VEEQPVGIKRVRVDRVGGKSLEEELVRAHTVLVMREHERCPAVRESQEHARCAALTNT
jgi:hypothetical protein